MLVAAVVIQLQRNGPARKIVDYVMVKINRRQFLKSATALFLLPPGASQILEATPEKAAPSIRRVRPGDASWPSEAKWNQLKKDVQNRLIKLESPLSACQKAPDGVSCSDVFKELKNPFYIGDNPALTQTSGWVDAWTSSPSIYAIAAAETSDVVAAVNFARENNLRLVVKGGGHSYQGTSNAADSLLIWTRAMNSIVLHDSFVGQGCAGKQAPQPAVSVGCGCIWIHVYNAVTTQGGRYVQGGGCATVGVAGLIQSGGFGSFSKNYGLAAAGLLEAEVVTADGAVRIANACTNPDLFWGLKGGGGGSLGVVTKLTLRTHELPEYFGGVFGAIQAKSDSAYRNLMNRILEFYRDQLFNPHWGEQIRFEPDNSIQLAMVFQGLNQAQAQEVWQPFLSWVASKTQEYTFQQPLKVAAIPAKHFWDPDFLKKNFPQFIDVDDRPGAPAGNIFWAGNRGEAGQFLHGYRSAWLPSSLLEKDRRDAFVEALFKEAANGESRCIATKDSLEPLQTISRRPGIPL